MVARFDDTIAAIATSIGAAGVSIIRISGDNAISIAEKIFKPQQRQSFGEIKNRVFTYGWLEKDGKTYDEAMICLMRSPHSYTAEDVVELFCHGGVYITQKALQMVLGEGARLASPGEFTQRAFLNGRIDLTQAEAVNDVIQAKSDLELEMVINQLKGKLHDKIVAARDSISWILALINANIDFPEEDTVFTYRHEIREKIEGVVNELRQLIGTADTGIKIKEGYHVVLTGKPNVGKSSLLNGLLGTDRAIVNQAPGTTRDTIEETLLVSGVPVSLIDTAGIHDTDNAIEKEGISRAISAVKRADLVLWVIDSSDPSFGQEYLKEFELGNVPTIMVLNKTDLVQAEAIEIPEHLSEYKKIRMSAHVKDDIGLLLGMIQEFVSGQTGEIREMTMLTNIRQKQSAEQCLKTTEHAKRSIEEGLGEEFISIDLSQALSELGEIVGETTVDDMLNQIFSNFCIGK